MQTECIADRFAFAPVEGRRVEAAFDGGAPPMKVPASRATGLVARFAGCFTGHRRPDLVEHTIETLVGQRVLGLALGYEDLVDHDELRHDPVMAVLAGRLSARRADCATPTPAGPYRSLTPISASPATRQKGRRR